MTNIHGNNGTVKELFRRVTALKILFVIIMASLIKYIEQMEEVWSLWWITYTLF